ncbi:hypothetical protein KY304_01805 [Candidatus Woesearchaeota archaeon]|nr:hypothetical protein [Candidatus Woesearchaeota archaeon]MBW2978823.1 hypothetical protein [Candidatus Woesearchaeota archaeon]
MDRQELIILFIVGIIAVLAMFLMYKNMDATGDAAYQISQSNVVGCNTDSDCYWAMNSLQYECRAGLCRPKGAIGPPAYESKLKLR